MRTSPRETPLRENKHLEWFPKDGLYIEMYQEAQKQDMNLSMYLEDY